MMEQFLNSSLLEEIYKLVSHDKTVHANVITPGFEFVKTSDGIVCAFSLREGPLSGPNIIKITDEQVLAKLRSVKGQFVYGGLPVFYYDLVHGQHYTFNPFAPDEKRKTG